MKKLVLFDNYLELVANSNIRLQRIFFSLTLLSLLFNYKFGLLVHQIGRNPLLYQETDPMYWMFMILKLPDIVSVQFPIVFDTLLILSCCCCIVLPRKKIFTIIFFIVHFAYFIIYNMMAGHHYINIGILCMSFPFVFSNPKNFAFAFTFIRFLFCYMMFTAALWKIGRGNLFYTDQLYALLVNSSIEDLASNSSSWRSSIIHMLLMHPNLTHILWIYLIILEIVFITGFIIFKYDKLLIISYLMFFVGGWLLLNIYNYENLLFLLTLFPIIHFISKSKKEYLN